MRKKYCFANRWKDSKAEEVCKALSSYFDQNGITRENHVRVSTDGAPIKLASRNEFICKALASRTSPAAMNGELAITVRVVNFFKTSKGDRSWLRLGVGRIRRIYLKSKMLIFLMSMLLNITCCCGFAT